MKKLDTSIQYIKGVGPDRGSLLTRLGIRTVMDILYFLPFRYEDRSKFTTIGEIKPGTFVTIKGEVKKINSVRTKGGKNIFQIKLDDGTGIIYGIWFNQPYLRKFFKTGQKIIVYGKAEKHALLQISHPRYEILKPDGDVSIHIGRIVPIYRLTQDLSQRYVRTIAHRAVSLYARQAVDMLPTKLRARNKLVDMAFSIMNIHFPGNIINLERAYKRIVFDEFFLLQLAVAFKKKNKALNEQGISHLAGSIKQEDFTKNLPFDLTGGQKRALNEIEEDMKSLRPMNRLVQGDVGSGKTIVAAYALLLTVMNANQGVFMAPTEILAEQHYMTLNKILADYDVNITLLIHGMSAKAKKEALEDIKNNNANIIVGTHALIQEKVEFKKLGLAVIDEQHKFGVSQRARLQRGQKAPDILLMTATPIPRTLMLTVYGDLDVSLIKELPPGRGDITTYWVSDSQREKIYNFLREEIAKGRQAYIVCPRLEETGAGGVKAAKFLFEELKERIFKDLNIELIHGKMDSKAKESVMKNFKKGNINILVSTVVIEVGIDVSNASVMVVENAERFGLSQLHQLRGRIGRGEHESYCVLVSDAPTENAVKRLEAMAESHDGFEIAEEDLKLRGPGDIFGTRQHGLPEIRFGNIIRDMEIMELARKEAFLLVQNDPEMKQYENRFIRQNLARRFKGRPSLAEVG